MTLQCNWCFQYSGLHFSSCPNNPSNIALKNRSKNDYKQKYVGEESHNTITNVLLYLLFFAICYSFMRSINQMICNWNT